MGEYVYTWREHNIIFKIEVTSPFRGIFNAGT